MRLKLAFAAGWLLAAAASGHAAESWREPATGMEFVAIPKGCFQMGTPAKAFEQEEGKLFLQRIRAEMPQHEVCVDAFWLGRHEVRESDWQTVMGKRDAAGPADAPVTGVTWEEASAFARKLTEMAEGKEHYRLPTEAEWEYACRAGARASAGMSHRDDLDRKAWFSTFYDSEKPGARRQSPQSVGKKAPNAFGLHDMLGNAWEWVQDGYRADAYAQHTLYNPVVAAGDKRVLRGGSIRTDRRLTRCEARAWLSGQEANSAVGLRLVRVR